jgi:hypothetical protein
MTTRNSAVYQEPDRIAGLALAHFRKQRIEVVVRRDRHGVSITEQPDGRPVARLRICGKDYVEVLWWNGIRWDEIGDFGGMRMPVREALEYIDDNYAGIFWPNR